MLDIELKATCQNWAFAPDAVVEWKLRDKLSAVYHQFFIWNRGGGETTYNRFYIRYLRQLYRAWGTFLFFSWLGLAIIILLFTRSLTYSLLIPSFLILTIPLILAYLKSSERHPFQWLQDFFLQRVIDLGSLNGFRQGEKNRARLYLKRYSEMQGDALLVISPYSIHDSQIDQTLLNRMEWMAQMKIRIMHIFTVPSMKNSPYWYQCHPDWLEETNIDDFSVDDFIEANKIILKNRYRIVQISSSASSIALIRQLDRHFPPNSVIAVIPSGATVNEKDPQNNLRNELAMLGRADAILVQNDITKRYLSDLSIKTWKVEIIPDL